MLIQFHLIFHTLYVDTFIELVGLGTIPRHSPNYSLKIDHYVNIVGYTILTYHKGEDDGTIPMHSASSFIQKDHSSSSQRM
jgi:hypothetical protein